MWKGQTRGTEQDGYKNETCFQLCLILRVGPACFPLQTLSVQHPPHCPTFCSGLSAWMELHQHPHTLKTKTLAQTEH